MFLMSLKYIAFLFVPLYLYCQNEWRPKSLHWSLLYRLILLTAVK